MSAAVARAVTRGRAKIAATLLAKTCTRQDAASDWVDAGTFACHYEEASPQTTGLTSFEGEAAGYGINLFLPVDETLNSQDRVVVDGMTLEVQRVAVVGTIDLLKRAACVKRGA